MNIQDCKTVLSLICMNLDRQVPEGLDQLWFATLADVPPQYGKAAAMECIQSSPFMPKVADIRTRALALAEQDKQLADRQRRLAIERARPAEPERRSDGGAMATWVWIETRRRAAGVTDPTKRAEISAAVVDEWRRANPGSTAAPRTGLPCPNPDCRCTHTDGCDAGWIEIEPDENGAARTMPCRTCNFRRYQILAFGDRRDVAMRNLRDTSDTKPGTKP